MYSFNLIFLRLIGLCLCSSLFIIKTEAQDISFEYMSELIQNALTSTFKDSLNLNTQILSNMSKECGQKFNNFTFSLKNRTKWALRGLVNLNF